MGPKSRLDRIECIGNFFGLGSSGKFIGDLDYGGVTIVAKILANRLSKVIDSIISPGESSLLWGEQIFDGPLILSETIDLYKKRKKKMMLFKADFEKAFDSIKAKLASVRTSILINGSPTLEFSLKRGLRQGDPLLPFLFIIVIEALHMALNNGLAANIFHGIKVEIMASYTGCEASFFPFTYIGLPIGSNMSRITNWEPPIDRFKARLSSWKANLLSIGGRLTLIIYVLGSLGWVADSYRQRIINWIDGARQLSTPFAFITKGIIQIMISMKEKCATSATSEEEQKDQGRSMLLKFQEIIPLNAGNVLGTEDNEPAKKWLALIRRTLDNLLGTSNDSNLELDSDFEESTEKNQSFSNRPSIQSLSHNMRINNNNNMGTRQPRLERRYSVSDRMVVRNQFNGYDPDLGYNGGLMGYLGNKGPISISMTLHQTSFCFICSHLTSGQKEGDELRRNADVMEILKKTYFPRVEGARDDKSSQTILKHDSRGFYFKSTRAKAAASKDDSLFHTISDDDEGLPDCLESENANAFHLKVLLNLYNRCYARQAVVDNAVNRRSRELLKVIDQIRAECDVLKDREKARDQECKELKAKCEAAMSYFDKNPDVNSQKWAGYQVSLLTLESKNAKLDRAEVVIKVVPYVAMELVNSDYMGRLVAKLVSSLLIPMNRSLTP
ncbi:RNA-directed DNA polymerase, eukaryota, reverse transcriptase zinc-binding domain protein [Tanacetum coccineum]